MSKKESYFDDFGRCIPEGITSPALEESRRYFLIQDVEINYGEIYQRISKHLGSDGGLTLDEFKKRSESILGELENNPQTKNITSGVALPFFLPKDDSVDIGQSLESKYLPALKSSFEEHNPDYEFVNHSTEDLTNNITIQEDSRHEVLIEKLKNETVVGVYFPTLLEFSIPASIEKVKTLPEDFLLAGGYDTCAAFIGYPNLLLREDGYPPMLWMSSLLGPNPQVGYHIEAYGYNLTFNRRPHLGDAAEYWANALVILG